MVSFVDAPSGAVRFDGWRRVRDAAAAAAAVVEGARDGARMRAQMRRSEDAMRRMNRRDLRDIGLWR